MIKILVNNNLDIQAYIKVLNSTSNLIDSGLTFKLYSPSATLKDVTPQLYGSDTYGQFVTLNLAASDINEIGVWDLIISSSDTGIEGTRSSFPVFEAIPQSKRGEATKLPDSHCAGRLAGLLRINLTLGNAAGDTGIIDESELSLDANHEPVFDTATKTWVYAQGFLKEHQSLKTLNGQTLVGSGNIQISSPNVIDTLDSTSTQDALSANQGRALKALVDAKADPSDIPTKTSDLTNDSGFITTTSLANYVTRNTDQEITGRKTFSGENTTLLISRTGQRSDNAYIAFQNNSTYIGHLGVVGTSTTDGKPTFVNGTGSGAQSLVRSTFQSAVGDANTPVYIDVAGIAQSTGKHFSDFVTLNTAQTVGGFKMFKSTSSGSPIRIVGDSTNYTSMEFYGGETYRGHLGFMNSSKPGVSDGTTWRCLVRGASSGATGSASVPVYMDSNGILQSTGRDLTHYYAVKGGTWLSGRENFNNITEQGMYMSNADDNSVNRPDGTDPHGMLKVFRYVMNETWSYVEQEYTDTTNTRKFYRYTITNGSSWTSWHEISKLSSIPTKTSQLTNDSGFLTQQTQVDYSQTDTTAVDYIKNKPTLLSVASIRSGTSNSGQLISALTTASALYNPLDFIIRGNTQQVAYSTDDYYISIGVLVGQTVDLTPVRSSSGFHYAILDVAPGDSVLFNSGGTTGTDARGFCFIDSDNKALAVAPARKNHIGEILTAPAGAAKLILNVKSTSVYPTFRIIPFASESNYIPMEVTFEDSTTANYNLVINPN